MRQKSKRFNKKSRSIKKEKIRNNLITNKNRKKLNNSLNNTVKVYLYIRKSKNSLFKSIKRKKIENSKIS